MEIARIKWKIIYHPTQSTKKKKAKKNIRLSSERYQQRQSLKSLLIEINLRKMLIDFRAFGEMGSTTKGKAAPRTCFHPITIASFAGRSLRQARRKKGEKSFKVVKGITAAKLWYLTWKFQRTEYHVITIKSIEMREQREIDLAWNYPPTVINYSSPFFLCCCNSHPSPENWKPGGDGENCALLASAKRTAINQVQYCWKSSVTGGGEKGENICYRWASWSMRKWLKEKCWNALSWLHYFKCLLQNCCSSILAGNL